jgi:hypothetical protein
MRRADQPNFGRSKLCSTFSCGVMTKPTLTKLAALSLCTAVMSACDPGESPDLDRPRGALLYDLSEAQLDEIHAAYLAEEDIELTRARLTAPFDCSLYDQFCEQVGPEAAYEITGEMVDLALEGATLEDIEAHFDARVDEAVALADEAEAQGEEGFRASGSWRVNVSGDYRLRTRNGITTPLIGKRHAWTEAQVQRKVLGFWSNTQPTQLCVNAGPNTQTYTSWTPYTYSQSEVIESFDPSNACTGQAKTMTVKTDHQRLTEGYGEEITWYYTIRAEGSASADVNGIHFYSRPAAFEADF